MDESISNRLLESFAPCLRPNIQEIFTDGRVGLSSVNMKLKTLGKRLVTEDGSLSYMDHFILEIPYAGKFLSWEIIFSEENYKYAPDFIFTDDMFLSDPDIMEIRNIVPSLEKWDVDNSKSLLNVIRELLACYKKYQIETLQTKNIFATLYEHYNTLITSEGFSERDVEVYIEKNNGVNFLTSMKVDTSCLPEYMQSIKDQDDEFMNPNEDTAILRINFYKPDGGRICTDLHLSPRLQQLLGPSQTLHIPSYNKAGTIADHVLAVKRLLSSRMTEIATNYKLKKEYISYFLSACSFSVLEYDNFLFSKLSFLYEFNSNLFLVQIDLGRNFPKEKPTIRLISVYQMKLTKPIVRVINGYPYSPRWPIGEMIKRLLGLLEVEVADFQTVCQSAI